VTSAAAAEAWAIAAVSSVGSIEPSTASERSPGIDGSRIRSAAVTPAASAGMWRSDGSSVYHAVGLVMATRAASVDFPKPAPPATIVSRRSVPSSRRASSAGRARVAMGSAGGMSFADRPRPARAASSRPAVVPPASVASLGLLTASGSAGIGSPANSRNGIGRRGPTAIVSRPMRPTSRSSAVPAHSSEQRLQSENAT
jgi:hypothetical protein